MLEEKDEKKKDMSGQEFRESLAELLYGEEAKNKNISYYSFYYDQNQTFWSKLKGDMAVRSAEREHRATAGDHKKEGMSLDDDMLQAAKDGQLFLVSTKEPFLQRVNVNENGKVSLEVVRENPLPRRDDLKGDEKKQWDNLRGEFENLTQGNNAAARGRVSRWFDRRSARKTAQSIAERIEKAQKKEVKEDIKELEAAKKQKEKEEKERAREEKKQAELEKKANEEKQQKEREETMQRGEDETLDMQEDLKEIRNEEKKVEAEAPRKSEFEKAWDLVREGNHQEAAAMIAQEMQNLSKQFDQSKYMDDNAIKTGMEIRNQMKRLKESGNVELLDKLEAIPEFKENVNLYQGQANLAEMGQKGLEARKQLEEKADDKTVDRGVVLDIMASEFANNVKMRMAQGKNVSVEMEYIGKQPNAEQIMDNLKEEMGKTKAVESLMKETGKELSNIFGRGHTSQQKYKEALKEVDQNAEKEERAAEKQKELKNDQKLQQKKEADKQKTAPQKGM